MVRGYGSWLWFVSTRTIFSLLIFSCEHYCIFKTDFLSLQVKQLRKNDIRPNRKFSATIVQSIPIPVTTQCKNSIADEISHRPSGSIKNGNVGNITRLIHFILYSSYIIQPIIIRRKDLWR